MDIWKLKNVASKNNIFKMLKISNDVIIDASEASILLKCSRAKIERLQLKGLLSPVPTIYPKYYFKESQVLELQKSLTSKKTIQ